MAAIVINGSLWSLPASAFSQSIDSIELSPDKIAGWRTVISPLYPPENACLGEVVSRQGETDSVLVKSELPYDPAVFGIIVADSTGAFRVATGGEVDVLVDQSSPEIEVGDWVVTSGASGRIMPAEETWLERTPVVGIALTDWSPADSAPTVRVLLTTGERVTLPSKSEEE